MIRDSYNISELGLVAKVKVSMHEYNAKVKFIVHGTESQVKKVSCGYRDLDDWSIKDSSRFKNKKMAILRSNQNHKHIDDIVLTTREIATELENTKGMKSTVFEILLIGEYEDGSPREESIRVKG